MSEWHRFSEGTPDDVLAAMLTAVRASPRRVDSARIGPKVVEAIGVDKLREWGAYHRINLYDENWEPL